MTKGQAKGKIQRLIFLAWNASASPNEIEVARKKAQKLMKEHGLTIYDFSVSKQNDLMQRESLDTISRRAVALDQECYKLLKMCLGFQKEIGVLLFGILALSSLTAICGLVILFHYHLIGIGCYLGFVGISFLIYFSHLRDFFGARNFIKDVFKDVKDMSKDIVWAACDVWKEFKTWWGKGKGRSAS